MSVSGDWIQSTRALQRKFEQRAPHPRRQINEERIAEEGSVAFRGIAALRAVGDRGDECRARQRNGQDHPAEAHRHRAHPCTHALRVHGHYVC